MLSNRAPYPVRLFFLDHAGDERPLKTLHVDQHVEYAALSTLAWRARTYSGQLLLEVSGLAPPEPAHEVVTVHVGECAF